MNLNNLTKLIEAWAKERELDKADPTKQTIKLGEEFGELCEGMSKGNIMKILDSIGDIFVVLTILSLQLGINLKDCVEVAYNEIKDRKGKLVNGVFVKESDLKAMK